MNMKTNDEKYEALLTSVKDIVEAEMIIGLMKSEGIPAVRKHNFTGDYLEVLGNSTPFGVDIFVPPSELERAKEILSAEAEITDEEVFSAVGGEPEIQDTGEKFEKNSRGIENRKKAMKWFIRITVALISVLLIYGLFFFKQ